ncbi:hypothetical protein VitviT2T_015426 [Vitis vinifera]|uniref:Squalene cyclase N-terminal domain-containing protein n=1 Tax=Vitis vinifera TaxID=29760 RepID=A0ABY9CQI9_VITVI|nr:hypothetical protein VitviT2T_015426 [Vitis vinifera]
MRLGEKEEVTYEAVTTVVRKAIMVLYFIGTLNIALTPEHKLELLRYITNHQNEDGGWGFHIEGHNTMLGTTLSYISMRILGVGPDDKAVAAGRKWILDCGGATYSQSWGKCFLSDYMSGLAATLCHQSTGFSFHFCPCIQIKCGATVEQFTCLCRIYMTRFQAPITDLVLQLREEMHTEPYHEIHWAKARLLCAKAFHMIVVRAENPDSNSDAFKHHLARIPDYLWMAEDGMKVQGFGSQLWDTSLCIQVILESGMVEEYGTTLKKGHDYVKLSQVSYLFTPKTSTTTMLCISIKLTTIIIPNLNCSVKKIHQVTIGVGIVTFQKEPGLSLIAIMVGKSLTAHRKR